MLKLKNGGMSYGDVSKYLTKNRHKNKSGENGREKMFFQY